MGISLRGSTVLCSGSEQYPIAHIAGTECGEYDSKYPCAARWIQFMFNNFEPEILRDAVGADRCSFGMPFIRATLDNEGKLNAKIGTGGQKSKMNSERGGGASRTESKAIARDLQESFTLIQRLGFRLYPSGKARCLASTTFPTALTHHFCYPTRTVAS
jgi:hypothetical protein